MFLRGSDHRVVRKTTAALLYEHVGTAVETLRDIMLHAAEDGDRLRAAAVVIMHTKDYNPDEGEDVSTLSDAELLARVRAVCDSVGEKKE